MHLVKYVHHPHSKTKKESDMSVTSFPLDYVPGPSPVTRDVLEIYGRNYSSSDLLDSFFEQYTKVQKKLGKALGVLLKQPIQLTLQIPQNSSVVVQSGEGMLGEFMKNFRFDLCSFVGWFEELYSSRREGIGNCNWCFWFWFC